MTRRLGLWCVLAAMLVLAGCGFGLRQPPKYAFASIYTNASGVTGIELRRMLRSVDGLVLISDPARRQEAQVALDIMGEQRTRTVVGVNARGQVRELQLRLVVRFQLRTPTGKELIPMTELTQQRTLTFDEAFALAKEGEEALLYKNMQTDMVQQIMRRLEAVKSL
jgi:LPS-assembly lipoprotein